MSSWTDNLSGGSGNVDARTGWGTNLIMAYQGVQSTDFVFSSGVAQRALDAGVEDSLFADFVPGQANYYAQCNIWASDNLYWHMYGPLVRGFLDAVGVSCYTIDIDVFDQGCTVLKVANGTSGAVGSGMVITIPDWTTPHMVKLAISGTTTTTIEVFIDGNSVGTRSDASSPFTAAGKAGIATFWGGAGKSVSYYSDFTVDDGLVPDTPIRPATMVSIVP